MKTKLVLAAISLANSILFAGIAEPIRLDTGLITGVPGEDSSVRAFKGIPYAAPPVGNLRWHAPVLPAKWDGIRKADEFSAACMQNARQRPEDKPFSEDCLYLNVWTAAQSANEKRPVMMWIFGGGGLVGNAGRPSFYGDALAKKGVVVVTINYRVAIMASFVHPELSKESGHNASGNYMLLDHIAALEWIHRNIAAFGGDPANVTVFGQSSGAGSVTSLLASPLAKGLFRKAICESAGGMAIGRRMSAPLAVAEKAGLAFQEKAGAKSLADLRAMPAADLLKIDWARGHTIDGWSQTGDLDDVYAAAKQNDVAIISGSNSNEAVGTLTNPLSAEKWVASVKREYGPQAEGYLKLYPADSDAVALQSQKNVQRDQRAWMARQLIRFENQTGKNKTWSYFFSRNPAGKLDPTSEYPMLAIPGAAHASEIVYVWNHLAAADRPYQDWDHKLADMMSSYWTNFAKTGNPNGPGLPEWPSYDAQKDLLMHFGDKVQVEQSPLKKVIDAVNPYWVRQENQEARTR
jgi:para-nitrobenzyl esterase